MTSPNDIWVTTFTGNLLHSTDAGATWKRTMRNAFKNREFNGNYQFLEPPQAMTSLALPDANNLFIAVGTGGVIDSTNGGTDWREMTTPSFGDITMRFDVVNGVAGFKGLAVGGGKECEGERRHGRIRQSLAVLPIRQFAEDAVARFRLVRFRQHLVGQPAQHVRAGLLAGPDRSLDQ